MIPILRVSIALVLTTGWLGCLDPDGRRPGFKLGGTVVAELPEDWSLTDGHREIALEVATPYWIPHSVTIWCASAGGQLYVAARDPDAKRWPGWVAQDPAVRLQIGANVYEAQLALVNEEFEIAMARRAYTTKYKMPDPAPADAPPMRYWRVEPRS